MICYGANAISGFLIFNKTCHGDIEARTILISMPLCLCAYVAKFFLSRWSSRLSNSHLICYSDNK
jgi:hypothetical protein